MTLQGILLIAILAFQLFIVVLLLGPFMDGLMTIENKIDGKKKKVKK
jgi:hypothetical protein